MRIEQVRPSNPGHVNAFVQLPHDLYSDSPYWVPNMRTEVRQSLDPDSHPFYNHGEAAFFLALDGDRCLGRIGAYINHRYIEHNREQTGFVGLYECTDNALASAGLFERALDWLKSNGMERVVGPKGLMATDGIGLLVDGFDRKPAMGIAYNPAYHADHFESAGLTKAADLLSGELERGYQLPDRVGKIAARVKQRRGYHIRRFRTQAELRQAIPLVHSVYNRSFVDSPDDPLGFTPLGPEDITAMADRLLAIAQPELVKIVMQADEPVGFLLAYPNIGDGLRRAGGRMLPFGWLHLWWSLRTTKWLDVNGVGVLPEHQGRGANAVMYYELNRTLQSARFNHGELVQVREGNLKSMGDMSALGVEWTKRHRLYHGMLKAR